MKNSQSSSGGIQFNSAPMVVGAVLIGVGSLMGVAGLIVGGTAMMSAARKWFRELDVPPAEVLKRKWGQTRAATVAGASAWQHHDGVHAHSGR